MSITESERDGAAADAALVPDALGVLEGVEVGHYGDVPSFPAPRIGA